MDLRRTALVAIRAAEVALQGELAEIAEKIRFEIAKRDEANMALSELLARQALLEAAAKSNEECQKLWKGDG